MDVSDTSDYSGSNFSSLSHTIFNEDLFDVKNQVNCASKDDPGYKNDLDNLEKVIELKFYKKFDKLMRLNVQLESKLSAANKFINSLQNDTILDSELKKLNFDLNFKINELECELSALKCNNQNNEKFLDSMRCENEEKSVLIDMKNNSIVGLKNKIVELHLQLLETRQTNSRSDHAFAVLTNELNAVKKSEEWYKKSLSECRLQKSALIEEVTNLQLQLITKNRDLQLEKLKKLDEKQKNYQIEAIEILTNELVDTKEICKRQKIVLDRIDGENQNLIAENGLLKSKLCENELLIGNVQKLNEKIQNCSCTVGPTCIYPSPDVSFNETDFRHFDSMLFAPVNEEIFVQQLPSKEKADEKSNLREHNTKVAEETWICGIEPMERKNSVSTTPVMKMKDVPLDQVKNDNEFQDLVKRIFDLDAEIQELKKSNTFSKTLLTTEIQQHEETVAELGIQYIGLQNEVGHLKDSNFKYFSELENLQITFQKVQEANKMNENQVETMRLENQDLKLEKLCYHTQIQNLRTENENLVRKHNSEVEELKETVNAKIVLLDNVKTENNELKTTKNIEKQKHKEEIAELEMQLYNLRSQIENLQCTNKQHQIETSTFKKEIEERKAKEEMAKQDLCGQILNLHKNIEDCQNKRNLEVNIKEELMIKLQKEEEIKGELQKEVAELQNDIRKCKCNSEVIVLQKIIEELKKAIEIKEDLIICSKEVEMKRNLEVESMQNLIEKLKGEADFQEKRLISTEENQDRLAGEVLALQNEILKSEAMKQIQIENIRKTSMELAESNDSILGLVANLNMESDVSIAKLKNENFDLRVETENLNGIIGKLKGELEVHGDVKVPKSSFGGKNILFEPEIVDDDLKVPNLVKPEGEEIIILKVEIKRLSALCKAKEMQNEENRERCEKGNRSLLNEIKEYKRRCAKMQKMYKQVSEELNSYKFNTNISKNEQIECSCDNYKNLLHNLNTHIEDLKQIGATEIFVQNGRTVHNDERIITNRLTSKTAMQKSIDNLQEEIDNLQGDLIKTRSEKYFLQRLCKDLKFSLQCCTSQTKMLKKQNDILKSLDCGKFSALLSKMPNPNKCDDTFIKELIKSSCQYQNPIRNLKNSMDLCKEEVIKLQKLVS